MDGLFCPFPGTLPATQLLLASDRISAFTAARGYTLYYAQWPLAGALNLAGSGALRARAAAGQAEGRSLPARSLAIPRAMAVKAPRWWCCRRAV